MAKNGTRNILIFTAGVATLVGAGVLIARARGETEKPPECRENVPVFQTIKIEEISIRPEGENFFVFDVPYHNQTCKSQDVNIFMQVNRSNGDIIQLQGHEFFLGPGATKFFSWRLIIPSVNRDIGKNQIEFFVWRSQSIPIPLANPKKFLI